MVVIFIQITLQTLLALISLNACNLPILHVVIPRLLHVLDFAWSLPNDRPLEVMREGCTYAESHLPHLEVMQHPAM